MLDEVQIQDLQSTFQEIDTDGTGMINAAELASAFERSAAASNICNDRIKSIM